MTGGGGIQPFAVKRKKAVQTERRCFMIVSQSLAEVGGWMQL
jgi:hypothetical protein